MPVIRTVEFPAVFIRAAVLAEHQGNLDRGADGMPVAWIYNMPDINAHLYDKPEQVSAAFTGVRAWIVVPDCFFSDVQVIAVVE